MVSLGGAGIYASVPDYGMRQFYYEEIIEGDSGHPRFLVFGEDVILLDCVASGPHSPGLGPSIAYYRDAILQAIESFDGTNTWTMTDFDFAAYTELPNR